MKEQLAKHLGIEQSQIKEWKEYPTYYNVILTNYEKHVITKEALPLKKK